MSYAAILGLAVPMILSMTGHTIMQFLDGFFLSRYSEDAIAAVGPGGMASWLLMSLLNGTAGYTSTFVAQYKGSGQPQRMGAIVWQGIHLAIWSGLALALSATFLAGPIFKAAGHSPAIVPLETAFFRIACWGAPMTVLGSAISGFFAGRGAMKTLMAVQVSGQLLNAGLAYAMIFGKFGLPERGLEGAAWAGVAAQTFVTVALVALFLMPNNRREYGTWSKRAFDRALFLRLVRFGFPSGFRFFVEMLAWTGFVFFVGRIGESELAATNIAWRINVIAFFPMIGLSVAVNTLVGQAQGCGRPDWSARCAWRGMAITQVWMMFVALILVLMPQPLIALFDTSASMAALVAVLLRYVAVYTLLDGFNVVIIGALQGAGDTSWTLGVSLVMHGLFLAVLAALDRWLPLLHAEWTTATIFVMTMAVIWLLRFLSGKWRSMRVIEPSVGS